MAPTILAIDVGHGNTKAVWTNPNSPQRDLKVFETCFRSLAPVTTAGQGLLGFGAGVLDRVSVPIGGLNYLVGPDASLSGGSPILDTDYVHRPEYYALVIGAIHYMMKLTGQIVRKIDTLALGLPVSNFAAKKSMLTAIGQKTHRVPLPDALKSVHGLDSVDVSVNKVVVIPQPYGALRYSLSKNIEVDPEFWESEDKYLVIDPGYNTFDWFVSRGMTPVVESCGSFLGGVSHVLREVSHGVGQQLGTGDIGLSETEKGLNKGNLRIGGRMLDFTPQRLVAKAAALKIVDEFLVAFNFSKSSVEKVFLVGGGAGYFAEALVTRLPDYDIKAQPDSVMANARGFWLHGDEVTPR